MVGWGTQTREGTTFSTRTPYADFHLGRGCRRWNEEGRGTAISALCTLRYWPLMYAYIRIYTRIFAYIRVYTYRKCYSLRTLHALHAGHTRCHSIGERVPLLGGCLPMCAGFCPATPDTPPPCAGTAGMREERGAGRLMGGRREGGNEGALFYRQAQIFRQT